MQAGAWYQCAPTNSTGTSRLSWSARLITKRTPEEAAAYLQGYRAGVEITVTRLVSGMSPAEVYDLLEDTLEIATGKSNNGRSADAPDR